MTHPPLWERDQVQSALATSLQAAHEGEGNAVFVVGEAGLGKTRVLERAFDEAAGTMEVGLARGEEMERTLAFGIFGQLARSMGDQLDLGGVGPVPAVEPTAPYHRVLRWIESRSAHPMLLAFDDLHFADADSLSLLSFLTRRLHRLPVAVIGTLRPWPPHAEALCRQLVEAGNARIERLTPIGETSVAALLGEWTGESVSSAVARQTWSLCNGNPLLVEQVALALTRGEGVPEVEAAATELGKQLLLARFAGVATDGLRLARAGSVLGTSFRPGLAAEVADIGEEAFDEAAESLFRSGLVDEGENGTLRFAHPLFAQALYEDISAPARQRLHARAFAALERRGFDAGAAEHALHAHLVGDVRAVASLERAGRAALSAGALASATRALEGAVQFGGDGTSPDLSLAYCEALTASGRLEEATGVCRHLLVQPDLRWEARIEVLRMLGRALYLTGTPDRAEEALDEAVTIGVANEPHHAIEPLLDQSLGAWLFEGLARALPLAARARELAADADPQLRERAEATWGHLALATGDPDGLAATEPLARHLEDPDPAGALDPAELTWPWARIYKFAMNANYCGRYHDAERAFKLARAIVERAGATNALATVAIYIANVLLRRGRLDEALREAIRARDFAELTPGAVPYADLVHAEALLWLGRLDESELVCTKAERSAYPQWFFSLWLAHVRGLRLLWEGDEAASHTFLEAERITRDAGLREPCHTQWAGHAVAAHLTVDRVDDALRVVEWLEECAVPLPCPWARSAARLGRAQLAWHAGDDATADEGFREALAMHDAIELPLGRVEALLSYGSFLRRRGRAVPARMPLKEAQRIAAAHHAGWLEKRALEELTLAGGRRRRSPERRDELTPAEMRVAEAAAAGDSNSEIARRLHLSVNTVETHLKHIYSKLGIHSRRQLRATGEGLVRIKSERSSPER